MVNTTRKPFQGVLNILRFNWHFYIGAAILILILFVANHYLPIYHFDWLAVLAFAVMTISLAVSCYIYDFTDFYTFDWLDDLGKPQTIVNINAGFDETSAIIRSKFPQAELIVFDFYNPEKHTEVSIQRARRIYPPFPGTIAVDTQHINQKTDSVAIIFVIFAAHEIRDFAECSAFFAELKRMLKADGKIILVEHLRDLPNFLAYTIGFFHFFPRKRWLKIISDSGLQIVSEKKLTSFTTTFTLTKHGNPS